MDAKLQRRVQRYGWDKAEAHYERFWQAQLAPAQERLLELAALQPGMRVLDVACGTGLVTFKAAALVGSSGAVTATDISDAMVARVAAEPARPGSAPIAARRMDAEALDFPDGSFDAALCALGLMYVPDPVAALREMRRVLAPAAAGRRSFRSLNRACSPTSVRCSSRSARAIVCATRSPTQNSPT